MTEFFFSQDGKYIGVIDDETRDVSWFPLDCERGQDILEEYNSCNAILCLYTEEK
jgi:hypothetical protein